MKLHLPLGLRRAVYHTFIVLLTGAAAVAGSAEANCSIDPESVAKGTAAEFDVKSTSSGNYLEVDCDHGDVGDGINIKAGTYNLPAGKYTLYLISHYEELDLEGDATFNGNLDITINQWKSETNPFRLNDNTLTMAEGTTLDATQCYYGISWGSNSKIISSGTVRLNGIVRDEDTDTVSNISAIDVTMSNGALVITPGSDYYVLQDELQNTGNHFTLNSGTVKLKDESLGMLKLVKGTVQYGMHDDMYTTGLDVAKGATLSMWWEKVIVDDAASSDGYVSIKGSIDDLEADAPFTATVTGNIDIDSGASITDKESADVSVFHLTSRTGNITLGKQATGSSALSALQGSVTLNAEDNTIASLKAGELNINGDSTVTEQLHVAGSTTIASGKELALSNAASADLGTVSGAGATLDADGSSVSADTVTLGTLEVDAASSLAARGSVTATSGGNIAGRVSSEAGDIALKKASLSSGALKAAGNVELTDVATTSTTSANITAGGTLTLGGTTVTGYATTGAVAATDLAVNVSTTLSGSVDVAGTTTIASGKELALSNAASADLGTVSGAGATLDADGSSVSADTVTLGTLEVDAASSLAARGSVTATAGGNIAGSVSSAAGDISLTKGSVSSAVLRADDITLDGTSLSGTNKLDAVGTVSLKNTTAAADAGVTLHAGTLVTSGSALTLSNNAVTVDTLDADNDLKLSGGTLVAARTNLAEGTTLTLSKLSAAHLGVLTGEGAGATLSLDNTVALVDSFTGISLTLTGDSSRLITLSDLDAARLNLTGAGIAGRDVLLKEGDSFKANASLTADETLTVCTSPDSTEPALFDASTLRSTGSAVMLAHADLTLRNGAMATFGEAGLIGEEDNVLVVKGDAATSGNQGSTLATSGDIDIHKLVVGDAAENGADSSLVTAQDITLHTLELAANNKVTASGEVNISNTASLAGTLEGRSIDLTQATLSGEGATLRADVLKLHTGTAQQLVKGRIDAGNTATGAGLTLLGNKAGTTHSLGDVAGTQLVLGTDGTTPVSTTATAEGVDISKLTIAKGSTLTAENVQTGSADDGDTLVEGELKAEENILLRGAAVTGTLSSAESNIEVAGSVSGAAKLTATRGNIDLTQATLTLSGGRLEAAGISLSKAAGADSTVSNGVVQVTEALDVGTSLTLDGGTTHKLAAVSGQNLTLAGTGTQARADSVSLATLTVGSDEGENNSALTAVGHVRSSGAADIQGTLTSTYGDISLGENSQVAAGGTVRAEDGDIRLKDGAGISGTLDAGEDVVLGSATIEAGARVSAAEGKLGMGGATLSSSAGNLTAAQYETTGNVNITGGTLAFTTTTVGAGTELAITGAAGDIGTTTVAGTNTKLSIGSETTPTTLTGNVTASEGGDFSLTGKDADNQSTLAGSLTLRDGGTAHLTHATVTGSVTLKGLEDTLYLQDSAIGGTLRVGHEGTVELTGDNTAGKLVLDNASSLVWNADATLTLGDGKVTGALVVDGASLASIAPSGLEGHLELVHGSVNIAAGGTVSGDITLSGLDTNDSFRILNVAGELELEGTLKVNDANNAINIGTKLTVNNLTGDALKKGDLLLSGAGSAVFQDADGSDYQGDITSELGGRITASTANALGFAGALKLAKDAQLTLTANQAKDIAIAGGTTTTLTTKGAADEPVELSGTVTGGTLALEDAEVELTRASGGHALEGLTVDAASALTAQHGGSFGDVSNKGVITLVDATLDSLSNEGTLTLSGVTNAAGKTAGAFSNSGTLLVDDSSALKVTEATLGGTEVTLEKSSISSSGDVVLNATNSELKDGSRLEAHEGMLVDGTASVSNSTLRAGQELTVSGEVTLSGTARLESGAEGMLITGTDDANGAGSVQGAGSISSKGDITLAEGGSIGTAGSDSAEENPFQGTVSSTAGDITLAGEASIEGAVAAHDKLTVTGTTSVTGEVTAAETAVTGGELTLTGNGDATGSSLGKAEVSQGGSLVLADDSFSGSLAIIGTHNPDATSSASISGVSATEHASFNGDITVQKAGELALTFATVNGNVTLEGYGDTLTMTSSTIDGTLSVGNGSEVRLSGDNLANNLLLDDNATLTWEKGATLDLGTGRLAVDGNSVANIDQEGMTGNVDLVHGTLNLKEGAQVDGNITLGADHLEDTERLIVVEASFEMEEDSQLIIEDKGIPGTNTIRIANSMVVEDLMGDGTVSFEGKDVTFRGDGSTHGGNIESALTGTLSATVENALGTQGALVLTQAPAELVITADQAKGLTINEGVTAQLTTANDEGIQEVELSGIVSGDTLVLEEARLQLTNSANELEALRVNEGSTLTTKAGSYENVTNEGEAHLEDSTLGSLVNNSEMASTVTGGSLGTALDNQKGELAVNGTTLLKEATLDNAGELTLTGVQNDGETVAGALSNTGELAVSESELTVASAALGGTVVLTESSLASTGTTEVTGDTQLADSTLSAATAMTVTGSLTGEGHASGEGELAVTGGLLSLEGSVEAGALVVEADGDEKSRVELLGTMTTGSLTATDDAFIGITGDGVGQGESSALGEVTLESSLLELKSDDVSGNIRATDASRLVLEDAAHVGNISAENSDVSLNSSRLEGELAIANAADGSANGLELTGDNRLDATASSSITGAISGSGTLVKAGEMLSLGGSDATPTTAGSYTIELEGGGITLNGTQRNGTLIAGAGQEVVLAGGKSTMGAINFAGDHRAAHNTSNPNATHVVITRAGRNGDHLASATQTPLNAGGAQLHVSSFASATLNDSTPDMLVGENITGFDKEIVHRAGAETNVNLVERNGHSYIDVSVSHVGAHKNPYQQSVSNALVSAEAAGATGQLGALIEAMRHTSSEAEALHALNQVGGADIASTMAAQMSATRDHMRTLRTAIGQPQPLPYESYIGANIRRATGTAQPWERQLRFPTRVWGMGTGSFSELGGDGKGGAGYTRHDWGLLFGSDVTLSNRALMGIAMGYSRSNVKSFLNTIQGDQYFVDVYGRLNTGRVSQSATFGVGFFDWSLDRDVCVNTSALYKDFIGSAQAQAKGMALNFSYEMAYNIRMKENHTLAPLFQFESSLNHINGFTEGGTLGNAALRADFDNTITATLGLGVRYAYEFAGLGRSMRRGAVAARAMLIGDVGDANATMKGSFIGGGAAFEAESTKIGRGGILVGTDVLIPVSRHWDVFGNASFELREDYRDVSFGAGVRCTF